MKTELKCFFKTYLHVTPTYIYIHTPNLTKAIKRNTIHTLSITSKWNGRVAVISFVTGENKYTLCSARVEDAYRIFNEINLLL